MKIKEFVQDKKNFNKGTKKGGEILKESLKRYGAGRSILLDKNNNIIAGNKTHMTQLDIDPDTECIIVETDGSKMVAVKRTDLSIEDDKGRGLALMDNRAAEENINLDYVLIKEALDKETIKAAKIEEKIKSKTELLSDLAFNSIYYKPKEKPNIKLMDCVCLEKYKKKIDALNEFDLTEDQKDVLRWFAYRFIKIDFENVANYYAFNATEEERKAMERLRLVLVDGAEKGFIEDELIRISNIMNEMD